MKLDIYKNKQKYLNWKKKVESSDIKELSKDNSDLIKRYIFDMEQGLNVAQKSAKGSRSHIRLNNLRQRLTFITKEFQTRYNITSLANLTEEIIFRYFNGMRTGEIKRLDGKEYKSIADYVNVFKSYWHWYMKVNRKNGTEIKDITTDLDTSSEKPKWVYCNEEQIKKLCDNSKYEYKVLIMFLFDAGVRSPTELLNIKVSDLYNDCKELQIREETSKTFGRRIKLMLCSEMLKSYIKDKQLNPDDYLFQMNYLVANRYIQRLAKRVLGEGVSEAGEKFSEMTLYDLRHCSCCYWLPRYKSESALKYRFGWKKSDKIHYYSELLGMKDTISQEDLLVDTTKTELEQRMAQTEKENTILKDKVDYLQGKMDEILKLTNVLYGQIAEKNVMITQCKDINF